MILLCCAPAAPQSEHFYYAKRGNSKPLAELKVKGFVLWYNVVTIIFDRQTESTKEEYACTVWTYITTQDFLQPILN